MSARVNNGVFSVARMCMLATLLAAGMAAVAQQGLFEATVPVVSQEPEQRASALRTALGEVLVRLTGDQSILADPGVQSILKSPGDFVEQYRYFAAPGDEAQETLQLRVGFNADALQQALRQQGVGYWGNERPVTLAWVAVDDNGERYLLSAESGKAVQDIMSAAAARRGLPILFPLMDLEDQSRLQFTDVWGEFLAKIEDASSRYQPQAILVGRLQRERSGGWSARWTMQVAGDDRSWSDSSAVLDELLAENVDTATDMLASRFAVRETGGLMGEMPLSVQDIRSFDDYARLSSYLGSLTPVKSLQVTRVLGDRMDYELEISGSVRNLEQLFAIGRILEPVPGGAPEQYRLRP